MLFLKGDSERKADYALNLVDRRIRNLSDRIGTKYELTALEYLDKAINQAAIAISEVHRRIVSSTD
jgi:hypothetical protein